MEKTQRNQRIVNLAREQYAKAGEIEFDSDAAVSEGDDNGAYVQAWVWVSFEGEGELDKEVDDEAAEYLTVPASKIETCCFQNCGKPATAKRGGEVYFPMCDEHMALTA